MTLFALVSESVWGGADGAMPRRGEIVIKPTGRKVRVVTITPAAPATAQRVRAAVQLASLTTQTRAAAASRTSSSDEAIEYGEQSVRLPYGYDPRENAGYGSGPLVYCPSFPGYVPESCYGPSTSAYGGCEYGLGFGYRGYAHRNYSRYGNGFGCDR